MYYRILYSKNVYYKREVYEIHFKINVNCIIRGSLKKKLYYWGCGWILRRCW